MKILRHFLQGIEIQAKEARHLNDTGHVSKPLYNPILRFQLKHKTGLTIY